MDREQFDFAGLIADGQASDDGDIAFDVDPILDAPEPSAASVAASEGVVAAIPITRIGTRTSGG